MKILFICGSIEPGRCGVGDYTRRMCGELIRKGHEVNILSLMDLHVISFLNEYQEIEGVSINVYRIPFEVRKAERFDLAQNIIKKTKPDWISLQFVPYSFNFKGLPFWLPSFLKDIKGNHYWHIMFHELWLGIDIESSFRHKCIGKLQQLIIKKIIQNTKPQIINTQNKLYQYFLKRHYIDAEILPICGNIPLTAVKNEVKEFTQFVLFGTIHNGAPFEDFIADLVGASNKFKKPIKFIFIGKNGPELSNYEKILVNFKIDYEVLGIQSENEISKILINSDFGISTTPYFQSEKSGVYAAYREHQLSIISVSRNWTPTKGQYTIPQLIKYKKNNFNIIPMHVESFDIQGMTMQFINSISTT